MTKNKELKGKVVYWIVQHQSDSVEFDNKTIHIFADKEDAEEKLKELNDKYLDWEEHFYELKTMKIE